MSNVTQKYTRCQRPIVVSLASKNLQWFDHYFNTFPLIIRLSKKIISPEACKSMTAKNGKITSLII